jgi:hypothetical protein
MALACFGLANKAEAGRGVHGPPGYCSVTSTASGYVYDGICINPALCTYVSCGSCPHAGTPVGKKGDVQTKIVCGFSTAVVDVNKTCDC